MKLKHRRRIREVDISISIDDHENCVSFPENKALELEKQDPASVYNTWIKDNRTKQEKGKFRLMIKVNKTFGVVNNR